MHVHIVGICGGLKLWRVHKPKVAAGRVPDFKVTFLRVGHGLHWWV